METVLLYALGVLILLVGLMLSIGLPEDTEAFLAALGEILNGAG